MIHAILHSLYSLMTFHAQNVILAGGFMADLGPIMMAIGTAYQIYHSEKAARDLAKQYSDARDTAQKNRAEDIARLEQQTKDQAAQLQAQKDAEAAQQAKMSQEQATNLASIRGTLPGIEATMAKNLEEQNRAEFAAMDPLIQDRLSALGLLQSGALPEAQAKYQAQLAADAQARIAAFDLDQQQRLNVDLPTANTEAQVALQNQNLTADINQAASNLTQQYASADANAANEAARQQFLASLGAGVTNAQAQAGQSIGQGISYLGGGLLDYSLLSKNPGIAVLYSNRNRSLNLPRSNAVGQGQTNPYVYANPSPYDWMNVLPT